MRRRARYCLRGCSFLEKKLARGLPKGEASRAGRMVEPARSVKAATHSATKRLNPAVRLPAVAVEPCITFLGAEHRKIRAQPHLINFVSPSRLSASPAGLSRRHRSIRGKRTAIPLR